MMVLVMGVSGSGKSSVGLALAKRQGAPFLESDSLHPTTNVAKMAAGVPLDDDDRAPWLDAIATWMAARPHGVVACSALKRAYRDRLRAAAPALRIVALLPPERVLAERLGQRRGHFMPGSLLASQLATLEVLGIDERALVLSGDKPVAATIAIVAQWLTLDPRHDAHNLSA
ncbi:gluconokinase [Sphingomonas rubra]|uniref:Gluconokinase n=1 Tax=Sphingomonas rubra TaxID=634430 RepID=A0A1I5R8C1_9SPHN|nr:gluconokinase [Sphingomonas rubra]SFP54246.1 gluconokinase [Sphingomonas rubra]